MNEKKIKELLREMREDPVPADSLVRVRQAVLARASASATGWRFLGVAWKLGTVVALVGCVGIAMLRSRTSHRPTTQARPPMALNGQRLAPPPAVEFQHTPVQVAAKEVQHARKKHTPAAHSAASVIRIETPDPEVVILLLGDGS